MQKKKFRSYLSLIALIALILVTACNSNSNSNSNNNNEKSSSAAEPSKQAAGDKQIVIGAAMQGNQSGFVQYMTSGMYEYQKGSAPDIKLDVVFADDDPAKQQSS